MIVCKECGASLKRIQWTHLKYKCSGKVKNVSEYMKKYPYAKTVSEETAKKTAITKENLIKKYGQDRGIEKWKIYCKKQSISNTYEYKNKKYGWDKNDYVSYNKGRAITKENLIKKYGQDRGIEKWKIYCNKQHYTNTKDYFVKKYGRKKGSKKYIEYNKSKGNSSNPFFVMKKYNISLNEAVKKISISKSNFLYISNMEKKFIDTIEKSLGYDLKYSYKTMQFSKWSHTLNQIVFFDGYDELTNTIYEFYGDFWHCNPKIYNRDYFHPIIFKKAYIIWEIDKIKKDLAIKNGFKYSVTWESEFINLKDNYYAS